MSVSSRCISDDLRSHGLEEDLTPIFAAKYWNVEFYIGLSILIIIIITISYFFSYRKYSHHDISQKTIKLKVMGIDPILQKECEPYLLPHVEYNRDIARLIFDYSGIQIRTDTIKQYLNKIFISNATTKSLTNLFISYLICSTLIIISYILLFHSILPWIESYRSFIEVPCVITGCWAEEDGYKSCDCNIDLSSVCDGLDGWNLVTVGVFNNNVRCRVHEETLKFRATNKSKCGCFCECGNYESQCCGGPKRVMDNCEIICVSMCFGIISLLCGVGCCCCLCDGMERVYRLKTKMDDEEQEQLLQTRGYSIEMQMAPIKIFDPLS